MGRRVLETVFEGFRPLYLRGADDTSQCVRVVGAMTQPGVRESLTTRAKRIVAEAADSHEMTAGEKKILRMLALVVETLDKPWEPEP